MHDRGHVHEVAVELRLRETGAMDRVRDPVESEVNTFDAVLSLCSIIACASRSTEIVSPGLYASRISEPPTKSLSLRTIVSCMTLGCFSASWKRDTRMTTLMIDAVGKRSSALSRTPAGCPIRRA
jgi:hypothetical protein